MWITKIKAALSHYWGELVFVFSNTYSLSISIVSSIVATAFVDPSDMGVIQSLLLVSIYLNFLHLGVFNGLNRNLAFYKAQGNHELVQDMVNTTYSVSYVVAIVGAVISISILLYYIIIGKALVYILSALLLLFMLVFTPISNAVETTYRSGQEFKSLGVIKNKETTLYAILTILPIIMGFIGKIISDIIKSVVGYVMRYLKRPYSQTGKGSKSSLQLLVRTGLPMLVSGYVWTVFVACDRTYIARYLGMENMGLYSIANYVMTGVMAVPSAVNTLLYPKAASRYGASGDVKSLKDFWKKSLLLYMAILIPLCSILYFCLPFFVEICMPKYVGGIKAAQYSLLSCMTFISMGPSVLFGTLRRNTLFIVILISSILLFWCIAMTFQESFATLESVSILRFALSFVQMIAVIVLTYIYVK